MPCNWQGQDSSLRLLALCTSSIPGKLCGPMENLGASSSRRTFCQIFVPFGQDFTSGSKTFQWKLLKVTEEPT